MQTGMNNKNKFGEEGMYKNKHNNKNTDTKVQELL